MNNKLISLAELGWKPVLQQQLSLADIEQGFAARVDRVHRDNVHVACEQGERIVPVSGVLKTADPEARVTTGDWLWLEHDTYRPIRILERMNCLKRTAAGTSAQTQLIAANIDSLFIVTSCNQDFNLSRLERYLSLALAAHIPAIIVLTKTDLCAEKETADYFTQAQQLLHEVPVISINALHEDIPSRFAAWTGIGQTIAFIGSSGVGKSTLTNALLTSQVQSTQGIREDDAKGRHTTTERSMFRITAGGWVLDTPGMRELRLGDDREGVAALFDDIEALMMQCRFSNCHHESDSGCAVQAALDNGELEHRRWQNFLKLQKETQRANMTKHQRHKKAQQWGKNISKLTRQIKKEKAR